MGFNHMKNMLGIKHWLVVLCVFGVSEVDGRSLDPLVLDTVHYNPGEKRYVTTLDNPAYQRRTGFTGKVTHLFDSPILAIDWASVDPRMFESRSAGRRWVNAKRAEIAALTRNAKGVGLQVFAQLDLVTLPKELVRTYRLEEVLGDPRNPTVANFLRLAIHQMVRDFPEIDGYFVRIGETYMHDAPFHIGAIRQPKNVSETIVPLMKLLREELCVKYGKFLVFRTWLSFDEPERYNLVNEEIEPHPKLILSVKHCEGDFHRGNRFSRVIGSGRHPQLIEAQCAREFEGKGAYPNYIARGVIEGFEEDLRILPSGTMRSVGQFARNHSNYRGMWIWSRGGGWGGPFVQDEFWCRMNSWVLARWAADPSQSEEVLFFKFCREEMKFSTEDTQLLRVLALKSADAVIRGKISLVYRVSPWWTRDDAINTPNLPEDPQVIAAILREKDDAVQMWSEMRELAKNLSDSTSSVRSFIIQSTEYGYYLYCIYRAIFYLRAAEILGKYEEVGLWLQQYDASWKALRALTSSGGPATVYNERGSTTFATGEGVEIFIARMRANYGAGVKK